jgi:hypothetical protein
MSWLCDAGVKPRQRVQCNQGSECSETRAVECSAARAAVGAQLKLKQPHLHHVVGAHGGRGQARLVVAPNGGGGLRGGGHTASDGKVEALDGRQLGGLWCKGGIGGEHEQGGGWG